MILCARMIAPTCASMCVYVCVLLFVCALAKCVAMF